MRLIAAFIFMATLLAVPGSVHATDKSEAERRVEASLRLPVRLAPPPYMDLTVRERRLTSYERYRDAATTPFGEHGVWRVNAAVRVEVFALVIPWDGEDHLLFLDNFAWPRVKQGKIDPFPILRSLGLR
jgi:hypothetical protein